MKTIKTEMTLTCPKCESKTYRAEFTMAADPHDTLVRGVTRKLLQAKSHCRKCHHNEIRTY